MLLSITLDYALYLLPEAQWGHAGVVVRDDLSGHAVHYEFRKVPRDLLHYVIFGIVERLGVISKVLINSAGVGSVYLRLF